MYIPFITGVDGILKGFNTTIKRLERLSDRKRIEAEAFTKVAEEASLDAGKAKLEAGRADVVAGKIRTLIS